MHGMKSTDAFNPMKSGSAICGMSEAALRSNTAIIVMTIHGREIGGLGLNGLERLAYDIRQRL
jgi:hypothetical protein